MAKGKGGGGRTAAGGGGSMAAWETRRFALESAVRNLADAAESSKKEAGNLYFNPARKTDPRIQKQFERADAKAARDQKKRERAAEKYFAHLGKIPQRP